MRSTLLGPRDHLASGGWELRLLELELTTECNLHCDFCYLGSRLGTGDMPANEAVHLLQQAHDMGVERLVLTGGEPTAYPHLDEVIGQANGLGWLPGLLSNGVQISDAQARELVGRISFLQLSLHDLPECNALARMTSQRAIALAKLGVPVTVLITLTALNLLKLERFVSLIDELGVPAGFQRLCAVGTTAEDSGHSERLFPNGTRPLGPADRDAYRRAMQVLWVRMQDNKSLACEDPLLNLNMPAEAIAAAPEGIWAGCSAGRWAAVVASDGAMLGCAKLRCSDTNVFEIGLRAAWNASELFRQLRSPDVAAACYICRYARVCRGCRADAYNSGLRIWDRDTLCPLASD